MILLCYGTRPEWIKIKPLVKEFRGKIPFEVLFTGQHEDISDGSFDRSIEIEDDRNRLDSIVSSVMNSVDFSEYDAVLIQGDTATAFAIALSAFNHKTPVVHLEAGLRTYDLHHPYPEEAYRQMISRITDIHLCPTVNSRSHLIRDAVSGSSYIVGNTVLDNLSGVQPIYGEEVLVTLHRRENHDKIYEWMTELDRLEGLITIVRHPNPAVSSAVDTLKHVKVIDPLPHDEMINRIANCKFLITDSGGLQEEGSFLKKRMIICRETTERPEVLDGFGVLCHAPSDLSNLFDLMNRDYIIDKPCPFGDGKSSEKIMEILCNYLK